MQIEDRKALLDIISTIHEICLYAILLLFHHIDLAQGSLSEKSKTSTIKSIGNTIVQIILNISSVCHYHIDLDDQSIIELYEELNYHFLKSLS